MSSSRYPMEEVLTKLATMATSIGVADNGKEIQF